MELGYQVNHDVHLLNQEMTKDAISNQFPETILGTSGFSDENRDIPTMHSARQIKTNKLLDRVQNSGTEVSYKCIKLQELY